MERMESFQSSRTSSAGWGTKGRAVSLCAGKILWRQWDQHPSGSGWLRLPEHPAHLFCPSALGNNFQVQCFVQSQRQLCFQVKIVNVREFPLDPPLTIFLYLTVSFPTHGSVISPHMLPMATHSRALRGCIIGFHDATCSLYFYGNTARNREDLGMHLSYLFLAATKLWEKPIRKDGCTLAHRIE